MGFHGFLAVSCLRGCNTPTNPAFDSFLIVKAQKNSRAKMRGLRRKSPGALAHFYSGASNLLKSPLTK